MFIELLTDKKQPVLLNLNSVQTIEALDDDYEAEELLRYGVFVWFKQKEVIVKNGVEKRDVYDGKSFYGISYKELKEILLATITVKIKN